MSPAVNPGNPLELYGDAAFARRMAAGLVGEGAAEDVWQEAWSQILERPPQPGWDLRGHVWTIVKRLALRHRRGELRRKTREQAVARSESLPSSAELVERMEVHRTVVAALLALEEPYRRTILLVFFEDLEPAEIAARDGIPVETVRTRKKRALAQLRERLGREHGREPEWLRGLLALAGSRATEMAVAPPAAQLTALALGIAAALVATSAIAWLGWRTRHEAERTTTATSAPPAATPLAIEGTLRREERSPRSAPPGVSTTPAPLVSGLSVDGRVRDEAGAALAGAEVTVRIAGLFAVEPVGSSLADEAGRFSLSVPALSPLQARARFLVLEAWAPGFQCVEAEIPLAELERAGETVLVLPPGRTLQGRVVDVHGRAVPRASVLARVRVAGADQPPGPVTTDSLGGFRLGLADGLVLESVEAWRGDIGWGARPEALPNASPRGLARVGDVVLQPLATLHGRATYPDGTPARDLGIRALRVGEDGRGGFARVARSGEGLERSSGFTDEEGRFALAGLCPGPFAFGALWNFRDSLAERGPTGDAVAWPEREEALLTVDRPRVLVEVLDPDGRPLEDVWVVCTPLAPEEDGGGPAGPSARSMTRGSRGRASFTGAPAGRFALTTLLPGWATELEVRTDSWETMARVELDAEAPRGSLRLLSEDGEPLAGHEVALATSRARVPLERAWRSDGSGIVHGLPAGRFRAEITDARAERDPWRLATVRELEIPAHGRLDVHVGAERGGHLSLSFPTRAEDAPAAAERAARRSHWQDLQTWAGWQERHPTAFLVREVRDAEEAELVELGGARPGERWTSARPFRPGRYRLETAFPGHEPTRQWVVVEAERTHEIVVPLATATEEAR